MADFDPDPLDDMETSLVDDYQAEAREARDRGDHARAAELDAEAARLYRVQNTGTADPYGIEPNTTEGDGAEPPETGEDINPSDVQGMPQSGMDDYKPWNHLTEPEQEDEINRVFDRADPEMSRRELGVSWPGADYDQNIAFADATLKAVPGSGEALRVLEAVSVADHPDLVRWLARVGRLLAKVPGDPKTVTNTSSEGKRMTESGGIQAQIDDLQTQIDRAQYVEHNTAKANTLYQRQLALYRRLPGGTDPIVDGVRTA